jgi:hypothetical protein
LPRTAMLLISVMVFGIVAIFVSASQYTNLRNAQTARTCLRGAATDHRKRVATEHCTRARPSLTDNCEVIAALGSAAEHRVNQAFAWSVAIALAKAPPPKVA